MRNKNKSFNHKPLLKKQCIIVDLEIQHWKGQYFYSVFELMSSNNNKNAHSLMDLCIIISCHMRIPTLMSHRICDFSLKGEYPKYLCANLDVIFIFSKNFQLKILNMSDVSFYRYRSSIILFRGLIICF